MVILLLADLAVSVLFCLVSPSRKHRKNGFVHCTLAAVKDNMYFVPLLLGSYSVNVLDIRNQLQEDYISDQISMEEYVDPFTEKEVWKK